ncbi:MAG: hypothetical protein M3R00_01790 [Pseudomonadota bacterium]|nr:hypothetical protein [Pseudomonadota bacterium]
MNRILYYLGFAGFALLCCSNCAVAETTASQSYGGIAQNLLGPVGAIISIVRAICIISGTGLLIGSLIRFSDYRKNPIEITLPTVVTMFAAGCGLILLAFIPLMGVKM